MYYYSSASEDIYSDDQMLALFGIQSVNADIGVLNSLRFYPVLDTTPNVDPELYDVTFTWTLVTIGLYIYAERVYSGTPKALSVAQANGSTQLRDKYNGLADGFVAINDLDSNLLAAVAAQNPASRPVRYADDLAGLEVLANTLADRLDGVAAATTVDEINNLVNPPTGVLNTGRGAVGPEDLNASTFTSFYSYTLTESDTELFITGTGTIVSYSGGGFPATPGAFNPTDYEVQLRQVGTGTIIATFECPLNPANEDISF